MIFIDRNTVQTPSILIGPNSKGIKETNKAIAHYASNNNTPFKFIVYSDREIKEALIKLFNGKCAYCESNTLHVYSGDVEHFRPKGKIAEATPSTPGYYWLAAKWDNLLLSCRNCNQKLTHQIYGESKKKTMGKMDQFPLIDNQRYIRVHDSLNGVQAEDEYRLLLNPCIDNPEDHLEFDEVHAVIRPKIINGQPSQKGLRSIEVYVLQRVPLVLAREKVLIDILAQIQRVKEAVKNLNDHVSSDLIKQLYFEDILKREFQRLKAFMKPTAEYSAMAKQIIGKFIKINFGI